MKFERSAIVSFLASASALAAGGGFPCVASAFATTRSNVAFAMPPRVSPSSSSFAADPLRMSDGDGWYEDPEYSQYQRYNEPHRQQDGGWGDDDSYGRRGGGGGGYGRRGGGGRGRGGGGYTRDTSRDNSEVDVEAVESLLEERSRAKRVRDYDTADAIRDKLLNVHRVGVYDKDRTWRTGASTSGSRMRYGEGGGGRGGGGRRDRDFGPNGHDYVRSSSSGPHSSPLSEAEIHSMIAERLRSKLDRNFDVADRIQADLVDAGVFVHDQNREWRSDGVPFEDLRDTNRGGGRGGGRNDRNARPYVQSVHSLDLDGDIVSQVQDMVSERTRSKMNRDYENADAIRDSLVENFNVFIDDRIREWSVGGDFGEEHNTARALSASMASRDYVKSDNSGDLSSVEDEEFVKSKIEERADAKSERDYALADSIRDELRDTFDVYINDKARTWCVGRDLAGGGKDGWDRRNESYICAGAGKLTEEELATVESMIAERGEAKRDRDYGAADQIRDELRDNYDVAIDDRKKEWRVDTAEYFQLPPEDGATPLTDEEVATVEGKLAQRFALKRDRDYGAADAIRDELRVTFGIYIKDREKQWRVERKEEEEAAAADDFGSFEQDWDEADSEEEDEEFDDDLETIFNEEAEEDVSDAGDEIDSSVEEESVIAVVSASSADELSSLTVVQLKDRLREAGKPVSGKKAELVERLLA